jgi:hypothetical protein
VASAAPRFAHPDVVCLPIADLPPSSTALAWRRGDSDARLSAFLDVARDFLQAASTDEPSRQHLFAALETDPTVSLLMPDGVPAPAPTGTSAERDAIDALLLGFGRTSLDEEIASWYTAIAGYPAPELPRQP